MKSVAGIFPSRDAAERAVRRLASLGIPQDRLTLLAPGTDVRRLGSVPVDEGEAPGTGAAIGAVTGVATGAGVGLPIIAFGLLGAALFGAGGAAIGNALENTLTQGVPRDDFFVIEDALRGGQSVAIAFVDDEATALRARSALADQGGLDFDTARDRWWSALPEAERGHFEPVEEHMYRCGFEAAQWCDNRENVRPLHGELVDQPAFQRGFERGYDYRHTRALRRSA